MKEKEFLEKIEYVPFPTSQYYRREELKKVSIIEERN
jgi:hypothetical protein